MSVDINWLLEGKIIHVIIEDDIDIKDVAQLSESILVYFEQSNAPLIHILVNKKETGIFPKSLSSISEGVKFLRHEQLGWFIIYGNMKHEKIAVFFSTVVTGITKVRHRRFENITESLEFLIMVDSTLPNIEEILS